MGGGYSTAQLEKTVFNMQFAAKQMARESKTFEKKESEEMKKVADAIKKNRPDVARIHAQNAIRFKNQALNMLRVSSMTEAVASRVDGAVRMKKLTKQMADVTMGMAGVLESMDLAQIDRVMTQFETQFGELDAMSAVMDKSMASSTATAIPDDEVDKLMTYVAAQNDLELKEGMIMPGSGLLASTTAAKEPGKVAVDAVGALPPAPTGDLGGKDGKGGDGSGSGGAGGANLSDLEARLAALRK